MSSGRPMMPIGDSAAMPSQIGFIATPILEQSRGRDTVGSSLTRTPSGASSWTGG
jgi:hypothetical protein